MAIGRPIPPLHLSSDERESLERWKRRPTTAQALALRSRIILRCSEGKTNTVVAGEIGLAKQTVGKWRARFIERRLDGLLDEPRPGGPRSITDTDVERVVTLTLETRGYVNRCVNVIRRRPSQPLIQWRFHPHTVHLDRRLGSTQGPSDA